MVKLTQLDLKARLENKIEYMHNYTHVIIRESVDEEKVETKKGKAKL